MAQPGPQQNFPSILSGLNFLVGKFLVIELYYKGKNTTGTFTPKSASFEPVTAEKTMPFLPGAKRSKKPDDLNLKSDMILTSGKWKEHTGPDSDAETSQNQDSFDEYRELLFINVALAEKDQAPDARYVEYKIELKGLKGDDPTTSDSKGYWAWAPDPDVPPPPTPADVFTVRYFDTLIGLLGPYPWIDYINGDVFNNQIIPYWQQKNAARGLPIPARQQGPFGGWANAAEQIASINAITQGEIVDAQIAGLPPNPTGYYPITYDFGTQDNGKTLEIEYNVKAGYYVGRRNFPYDAQKNKQFPDAPDDTTAEDAANRMATFSITKTKPSDDTTLTIRLSKDNKVSIIG